MNEGMVQGFFIKINTENAHNSVIQKSDSYINTLLFIFLQRDTITSENYWSPAKHRQIIPTKKMRVASRRLRRNRRATTRRKKRIIARPPISQRAIDRMIVHWRQNCFRSTLRTRCCYGNLWNCRSWIYFWTFGRIFYYFITIIG